EALANLAQCDAVQGRFAEARGECLTALRGKPDNAALHEGLANALGNLGNLPEAIGHLKIALRFAPKTSTRLELADLLIQSRDFRDAGKQYREVLAVEPTNLNALNNLASVLISCPDRNARDGEEAVKLAERACELTAFKESGFMKTLEVSRAEEKRLSEAAV